MSSVAPLVIAKSNGNDLVIIPSMANRHGLIAGATGTGKTVTLQKMAESFSQQGVPVFLADIKGDLTGIGRAGQLSEKLQARLEGIGVNDWEAADNPMELWDVFAEQGLPVRATISDMGPILLARLLNLNETQSGVLQLVFKIADDNKLLLLNLKDLRNFIQFVGQNNKKFTTEYGNVSTASIGSIQRGLLALEEQGASLFLGEPMLDIHDLMRTDSLGRGIINVLAADKLFRSPKLYAIFLLWLLSELFEQLPEVGDQAKPKMIFFFDEAHLLFTDIPSVLLTKIEQVVRLIRSKGVGVYFATQNPLDIPDTILGQLGNRVQHALRAFTPSDQKAVRVAAQTMRTNPEFKTEQVITELAVGEALISFLDEKGRPNIVERASVIAPCSRMGPISLDERNVTINNSLLYNKYAETVDRFSAYEALQQGFSLESQQEGYKGNGNAQTASTEQVNEQSGITKVISEFIFGSTGPRGGKKDGLIQSTAKSVSRQIAKDFLRGILGVKKR